MASSKPETSTSTPIIPAKILKEFLDIQYKNTLDNFQGYAKGSQVESFKNPRDIGGFVQSYATNKNKTISSEINTIIFSLQNDTNSETKENSSELLALIKGNPKAFLASVAKMIQFRIDGRISTETKAKYHSFAEIIRNNVEIKTDNILGNYHIQPEQIKAEMDNALLIQKSLSLNISFARESDNPVLKLGVEVLLDEYKKRGGLNLSGKGIVEDGDPAVWLAAQKNLKEIISKKLAI